MKIVHVIRQYIPSVGGMEDVVRNLAVRQAQDHGHHVSIVTLNRLFRNKHTLLSHHEIIDDINIFRIPYFFSEKYPIALNVGFYLKEADIVHVHGVDFFFDFLALTKFFHRKKLVASTHGGFFHTSFAKNLKKIYFNSITRLTSQLYDKLICISENDKNLFSQIVQESKLATIENGVDIEKFCCCSSESLKKTIIYFGRWSSNKGLLELIHLFERLIKKDNSWRLIIAGREYDITKVELDDISKKLSINEYIDVISSPSNEELRQLISHSSYFCCLSKHEGFGLAAIEAMSAGLIPILSPIPPFNRLKSKYDLVCVLEASDLEKSTEQIIELHSYIVSKYADIRHALVKAVTDYNWNAVVNSYHKIYCEVADE